LVRKIAVRKILGNHASFLRDRDILFLEEKLRKGLGNIRSIRKKLRKGLGNIRSIVAIRKELGSFVRKRIRKLSLIEVQTRTLLPDSRTTFPRVLFVCWCSSLRRPRITSNLEPTARVFRRFSLGKPLSSRRKEELVQEGHRIGR
jgi:hypothetical protein